MGGDAMIRSKILFVEDEKPTQNLYRDFLDHSPCREEFVYDIVSTGEEALRRLEKERVDLIVLDWTLPGISGLETLSRVRRKDRLVLIIMATARSDAKEITEALEAGADDYLTKPFDMKVFLARLHSLKRRRELSIETQGSHRIEDLEADLKNGFLFVKNDRIELSGKERDILAVFLHRPNVVHSTDYLSEVVWGYDIKDKNILERHLSSLRKKLGKKWGDRLKSKHGCGYYFETSQGLVKAP